MGTAGRSAPLRRTGSLLGLLGLEVAALVGLHWLGRFEGLRIGWDDPVAWLLSSPVQGVLGALLRTVGLVMAYWLLVSTVAYLLASLTRLPSAVRAVRWATLPMVRRVADHAVAVTLATSMVGGGTLGVAGPALAADRGRAGPPARKPVAAAQATDSTAYGFEPAEPGAGNSKDESSTGRSESSTSSSESTTSSSESTTSTSASSTSSSESTTSTSEVTTTTKATTTSESTTTSTSGTTTTTTPATTSTTRPTTTTPTTTSTTPTTTSTTRPTTTTERETTTTRATTSTTRPETTTTTKATTTLPPAYVPAPAGGGTGGTTSSTTGTTTPPSSSTTTGPRAYEFNPATPSPRERRQEPPKSSGGGQQGAGQEPTRERERRHEVVSGDNLWAIARERLAAARSGGSGEPTNREVAEYWMKVVEANKHHLRSRDPDLIYPGEEVILPPVN